MLEPPQNSLQNTKVSSQEHGLNNWKRSAQFSYNEQPTLGARDFLHAVSGFGQLYSNPDAMPRDLSVISLISQTKFQV